MQKNDAISAPVSDFGLGCPLKSHSHDHATDAAQSTNASHLSLSSSTDMSSSASSSKPTEKQPEKLKEEDSQPHLGVLEEDDEFEEFEVAGDHSVVHVIDVC